MDARKTQPIRSICEGDRQYTTQYALVIHMTFTLIVNSDILFMRDISKHALASQKKKKHQRKLQLERYFLLFFSFIFIEIKFQMICSFHLHTDPITHSQWHVFMLWNENCKPLSTYHFTGLNLWQNQQKFYQIYKRKQKFTKKTIAHKFLLKYLCLSFIFVFSNFIIFIGIDEIPFIPIDWIFIFDIISFDNYLQLKFKRNDYFTHIFY